ncbi:Cell wall integrity and stress response component [Lachnellula willkommii]|nr:Cell wall integrity and stress response component [Lachnellula willkommii]
MKSISSLVFGGLLLSASHVAAYGASAPGAVVYKGCYSSSTGLTMNSSYTFNTQGYCQKQCAPLSMSVLATKDSTDCWCGDEIPPTADLVSDSHCDAPCAGYGQDMCGSSLSYWSVWLSGVASSASTASVDDTSTSSAAPSSTSDATSTTPAVVTAPGSTVVITAAPGTSESAAASSSATTHAKGGPNKAAIAAGVVVGIVAFSAIAGGLYLFMRNKKRRAVEDEYRRNAANNTFIAGGGKPPNSSGGDSSFTDTRLDQATMAQRRMSDGSIADNQDYSRRILKV